MRVTVFSTFHNSSVKMNIKENQIVMLWGRKAIELTDYQARRAFLAPQCAGIASGA